MSHSRKGANKSQTICFRVQPDIASHLLKEARLQNISIHEMGRQRLLLSLAEQSVRDELQEVRESILALSALVQELFIADDEDDDYDDEDEQEEEGDDGEAFFYSSYAE